MSGKGPKAKAARAQVIAELVREAPTRDLRVLTLRYGLGGEREHTLTEIGVILGVSRERVSQLERRALRRLADSCPDGTQKFVLRVAQLLRRAKA
jgi:DNA-directed RNA polymerase sigma subunit (sigma70/sigma32)